MHGRGRDEVCCILGRGDGEKPSWEPARKEEEEEEVDKEFSVKEEDREREAATEAMSFCFQAKGGRQGSNRERKGGIRADNVGKKRMSY